jgi:hypothetical protein
MPAGAILRIARPTDNLAAIAKMYAAGLGFTVLAEFHDHAGFDGVILGHSKHPYHLEFTAQHGHQVGRAPTKDHLLVFYLPDRDEWETSCARMLACGVSPGPIVQSLLGRAGADIRGSGWVSGGAPERCVDSVGQATVEYGAAHRLPTSPMVPVSGTGADNGDTQCSYDLIASCNIRLGTPHRI